MGYEYASVIKKKILDKKLSPLLSSLSAARIKTSFSIEALLYK